ncbi:MAG: hypothetical protein CO093_08270 [Alphaproteobacteria bacterium CG_4_9_14_3_um_filter_47_13]|nr:MAG: hypothetical protein CO093_08270 [Alphaproteobacteria bacterium CG_4_9_14_3_um_filter_47_13]
MPDDLKDLENRINKQKKDDSRDKGSAKEYADRSTGMRAGSEFIGYIFSGALVGWTIGHFFGNMPLWLILMMFFGFGLGIYRASQTMK